MTKRTSINSTKVEENLLKKQKVQKGHLQRNKEIYWFNKNTFRTFDTASIQAFCLHSAEPLIVICSSPRPLFTPVVRIYTLDGNLVTVFSDFLNPFNIHAIDVVTIHLSSTMMLTMDYGRIMRCNDYNIKSVQLSASCIECDSLDHIYLHDYLQSNKIDIYSPDLEYVRTFTVDDLYIINSIRVQEDNMVILSSEVLGQSLDFVMLRYSLSKGELLQTFKLNKHFFLRRRIYISFDPVGNILISCNQCDIIAVWYLGGRIRYYKTPCKHTGYSVVGLAMSKNFQLIRAMSYGAIKIYEPK